MANFGYGGGNNYTTTTSYGAQGGAEGGGFMQTGYGGSQGGSQDTGGGSKSYGKDTLRPVTIKQMIDAEQPHPEAEFKIDKTEVTQLSFIGQVQSVLEQATNITYKLDDGTGMIDVKQWIDSDAPVETRKPTPKEGQYIRVYGRLKSFNSKRHVGAHVVRPIEDFNEISMHLLEATYVHLFFTKDPPEAGGGIKAENDGLFVGDNGGTTNGNEGTGTKKLPARISNNSRRVYELLSKVENNEGLHVHNIASKLSMELPEVYKCGDELLGEGCIFTTIDDETWAILEY